MLISSEAWVLIPFLNTIADPSRKTLRNVDLVIDTVGGDTLDRSWRVVRRGGALISVVEEPPPAQAERFGVSGKFFIVEPNRAQLVELAKLVDDGSLKPILSETFPLSAARRAYEAGSGALTREIVFRVRRLVRGRTPCRFPDLKGIQHTGGKRTLAEGVEVDYSFSNKPPDAYPDYYEKVTSYFRIISAFVQDDRPFSNRPHSQSHRGDR